MNRPCSLPNQFKATRVDLFIDVSFNRKTDLSEQNINYSLNNPLLNPSLLSIYLLMAHESTKMLMFYKILLIQAWF